MQIEESSPDEIEPEEFPEEKNEATESSEETNEEIELEQNQIEDLDDLDFSDEFAILKEMEEDLREHLKVNMKEKQNWETLRRKKKESLFRFSVAETSLQEHLLEQLKLVETSVGQREACEYLIGSLDENGFVSSNLSDLGLLSGIALGDLQSGSEILQSFDPVGIASKDLQECLMKQMDTGGMGGNHRICDRERLFPTFGSSPGTRTFPKTLSNPPRKFTPHWKRLPNWIHLPAGDSPRTAIRQSHLMQQLRKSVENGSSV